MSQDGQPAIALTRQRLGLITLGSLAVATIVMVGFILPAEYQIDPTGLGKVTGLFKLGTPMPKVEMVAVGTTIPTHDYAKPFRSDALDIPLVAGGDQQGRDQVEYKVRMKAGDSLIYSWSVAGVPTDDEFYYDFHGETPAGPGGAPAAKVIEYKQSTGRAANGSLIAPIPGVHGWYLQNQSAKPVIVKLRLSGFYELVPAGEYGNQAGIVADRSGGL